MKPASSEKSRKTIKPGSPQTGEPVYLTIGKLRRTHGVRGEIIMDALTDFPDTITTGMTVYIGGHHKQQKISSVRPADKIFLIAFEGFDDCDKVGIFRNQFVFIKTKDAAPLEEGKFYQHEVMGMDVMDESGVHLGKISEILNTGANDVYVIQPESGEELLIPAIKSVVLEIDTTTGKMRVRLPEWE
jgi:16S rRNA processing protein RimM